MESNERNRVAEQKTRLCGRFPARRLPVQLGRSFVRRAARLTPLNQRFEPKLDMFMNPRVFSLAFEFSRPSESVVVGRGFCGRAAREPRESRQRAASEPRGPEADSTWTPRFTFLSALYRARGSRASGWKCAYKRQIRCPLGRPIN